MSEAAAAPEVPAFNPPAPQPEPFRFDGRTGEYFGIWIVNLFLTILTVGIYSPWAKVRKKRYFYGNTWLAGANFEYHGNPVAILKGRAIAFIAFMGYSFAANFSPHLGAAILLAMMPAVPWIIVKSMGFNAVNSSYRNLRFHFTGTYREALNAVWPFALIPLLALLLPEVDPAKKGQGFGDIWFVFIPTVLALFIYPYVMAKVKLLHVNRSRYGTAPFACTATVGQFYVIYLLTFLLFFVIVAVAGFMAALFMKVHVGMFIAFVSAAYIIGGALVVAYTRSRIGNAVFNATTLEGGGSFISTLKARKLAMIYATNLLAIVFSLGFAIPWAAMRTARYRADCMVLEPEGDLDTFVAAIARNVGATGEEMGEMFDVDLSL